MLTASQYRPQDPVESLSRVQRRSWRRVAERITTDHRRESTAVLRRLAGQPVLPPPRAYGTRRRPAEAARQSPTQRPRATARQPRRGPTAAG